MYNGAKSTDNWNCETGSPEFNRTVTLKYHEVYEIIPRMSYFYSARLHHMFSGQAIPVIRLQKHYSDPTNSSKVNG